MSERKKNTHSTGLKAIDRQQNLGFYSCKLIAIVSGLLLDK